MCWRVGKGCGEGNGEDVGKCVEVWGPNTRFNSPHLPTLTFPTPPFIPLPTSLLPPPTPQHIFLLSPHLPSPSQSVAKLPCDEVTMWRSYCGEVTKWRSYWQPLKLRQCLEHRPSFHYLIIIKMLLHQTTCLFLSMMLPSCWTSFHYQNAAAAQTRLLVCSGLYKKFASGRWR